MTEQRQLVVCDAGPVIHLDELHCLDLLSDFSQVIIAPTVFSEIIKHRPGVSLAALVTKIQAPENVAEGLRSVSQLFTLHLGEIDALRLMFSYPQGLFLTDDTAARSAAGVLGFRVHGTIGLLIRSVRRGLRSSAEVSALLESIPQRSTLHIQADLLESVIAEVRESSLWQKNQSAGQPPLVELA